MPALSVSRIGCIEQVSDPTIGGIRAVDTTRGQSLTITLGEEIQEEEEGGEQKN